MGAVSTTLLQKFFISLLRLQPLEILSTTQLTQQQSIQLQHGFKLLQSGGVNKDNQRTNASD